MQEYEELMGELIELGITANPVTPFACCIIDPCGQILVTAANAMHISPLFSAEGLALHMLAGNYHCKPEQKLTLVTNAEPDSGAMTAIVWARCNGITISRIIFGASRAGLKQIWECDFSLSAEQMLETVAQEHRPELTGQVIEEDCLKSFREGKKLKEEGDTPVMSLDLDDYWMAGDWLLDLDDPKL